MKKYLIAILLIFYSNSFAGLSGDLNVGFRCDETYYIESICYPSDASVNQYGQCTCPAGGCNKCPVVLTSTGERKKDYYCHYPINALSIIARYKNTLPFKAKISLFYEEWGHDNSCGPYDKRPVNCDSIAGITSLSGPIGLAAAAAIECTQSPTTGYVKEYIMDYIRFDYKQNNVSHQDQTEVYDEFYKIYASPATSIGYTGYYAVMPRLEYVKNQELGIVDKIIRFYFTQDNKHDANHSIINETSTSGQGNYFNFKNSSFAKLDIKQSVFYQEILSSGNAIEDIKKPGFYGKFWKPMEYCRFYDKEDFKELEGVEAKNWSVMEKSIFTDNPVELPELKDKTENEIKEIFNFGDSKEVYRKDKGIKCYNNPYIASLFAKKYVSNDTNMPVTYESEGVELEFPDTKAGLRLPPPVSEPFFPSQYALNAGDRYFLPEEPKISWDVIIDPINNFLNPKASIKINAGSTNENPLTIELNNVYDYDYQNFYNYQFYLQIEKNQNADDKPELCLYMCSRYNEFCSVDILSAILEGENNIEQYLSTSNKILRDNAKNLFRVAFNSQENCYKLPDYDIEEGNSEIMVSALGIGSTYDNPKMGVRIKERNVDSKKAIVDLYRKNEITNSLSGIDMIEKEAIKNSSNGVILRPELITIQQEIQISDGIRYCQYYYPKSSNTLEMTTTTGGFGTQSTYTAIKNFTKKCILHEDKSVIEPKFYHNICLHNALNREYSSNSQFNNLAYSNLMVNHAEKDLLLYDPSDAANNQIMTNFPLKQIPFLTNMPNKIRNHYKDDYKMRVANGDVYYQYYIDDKPLGAETDIQGHNLCSISPRKILYLSYDLKKEKYNFNEGMFEDFSAINPIYDIKITYRDPKKVNADNVIIDGDLVSNTDLFDYSFSVDAKILKDRHNFYDGPVVDSAGNKIFSLVSPNLQPENTIDLRHSSPSKPKSKTSGIDTESVIIDKKFDYFHDLKIEAENIVDYGANNQKLCLFYRIKNYEACNCFNKDLNYEQMKTCYKDCNEWNEKIPFSNGCHQFKNCPATNASSSQLGVADFASMPETLPFNSEVTGTCPSGGNTVKTPKSRCDQYGNWHYLQGHCIPGCPAKYSSQTLRYDSDGSSHAHGLNGNDDHNNQRFYFAQATADYTESGNQDSTINREIEATTYCDYRYTGQITAKDTCLANNVGWLNNVTKVSDNCQRISCPAQKLTFNKDGKTYEYYMPSNLNSMDSATYSCNNFRADGGSLENLSREIKIKCDNQGNFNKNRESTQEDYQIIVTQNQCAKRCFGKPYINIWNGSDYEDFEAIDNIEDILSRPQGMDSASSEWINCDKFAGFSNTGSVRVNCNDGVLTTDDDYHCKRKCDATNYNFKDPNADPTWVKSVNVNAGIIESGSQVTFKCNDRLDLSDDSPRNSYDDKAYIKLECYDSNINPTSHLCRLLNLNGDANSMLRSGNGHCLDFKCDSNNCKVIAYKCEARNNRQFYRHNTHQIKDKHSGKCMNLNGNDKNGVVKIYSCHDSSHRNYDHQKWYYDYNHRFVTRVDDGTYQCLQDMGFDKQVEVRDCNNNSSQKWYQY